VRTIREGVDEAKYSSVSDVVERLGRQRYLSLTTFRRNGAPVATPIWFALDGDRLVAFTGAQTGKVKRIVANGRVTVAPCTLRGRVTGPTWSGTARILPQEDGEQVMALIRSKYRVTKMLLDLVVATIRVVARRPQTHSVYLEVRLDDSSVGT